MLLRLIPLLGLLQAYCIYHAYRHTADQKWYWIILFLPFIGSLIYLYENVYVRRSVVDIQEGIKSTLNSNYAIQKLEADVRRNDSFANKIALADEYLNINRLTDARELYTSSNTGNYKDYPDLLMQLIKCCYLQDDYAAVVDYGAKLQGSKVFKHSEQQTAYAWSLYHLGKLQEAHIQFAESDNVYCNYPHRLEYAYFLKECNEVYRAKQLTTCLLDEIATMDPHEQKRKRVIKRQIQALDKTLASSSQS